MPSYPYIIPSPNIYKPWIKVRLGYNKTHKITPAVITALVDSGADVCFCTKDIGIWLGIKFKGKEETIFSTANRSSMPCIKETISLTACGKTYNCPFYFTDVLPSETPIILGQIGFFDSFKVTFDLKNTRIDID